MELDHVDPSRGSLPDEYEPHLQGRARIHRLASPFGDRPAVSAVHFEAGARTRPHVHRAGQLLAATAGEGIVADRSGPRTVRPGDVVTVEPASGTGTGGPRPRP